MKTLWICGNLSGRVGCHDVTNKPFIHWVFIVKNYCNKTAQQMDKKQKPNETVHLGWW